jgi:hypothetical protein
VDVVEEMVRGMVSVHRDQLVRLEGFTVLLHKDIDAVGSLTLTLTAPCTRKGHSKATLQRCAPR